MDLEVALGDVPHQIPDDAIPHERHAQDVLMTDEQNDVPRQVLDGGILYE